MELKNLQSQPVEGFTIDVNEDNLFVWTVGIYGPPKTLYQGGYFKASIRFPSNYPYSPPSMKFTTKVWHPNVYEVSVAARPKKICFSVDLNSANFLRMGLTTAT